MIVAKESYACINYITLFLQELLHQRLGFCTKVIYYAPKSGSSLNCIVFSSVIDPCMGSGHILVYAFEVLMQIYLECGYTERDATSLILENNLFGLDIDDRAYQLAYFAVMMKARSYDRRVLTRGIKPNVYSIKESNFLADSWQKISDDEKFREIFQTVVDTFIDAKEYGSILNVPDADYDYALSVIDDFEQNGTIDFETQILLDKIDDIRALVNQAKLLSQKYDVVVTNPPYMPVSNSSASLQNFVKKNYPDSKTDMFAVFIERVGQLTKPNRYSAMITMHSWMFLSSYEKLRSKILETDTVNMAHLGARAFEEIGGEVVQTTAWVERKTDLKQFKATYKRLVDENSQTAKEQAFLNKNDNTYNITKTNFSKIPGSPVAYWVSDRFDKVFDEKHISDVAKVVTGMTTADNERFLRLWFEINLDTFSIKRNFNSKWFPYQKGGNFCKWYGDNEYVVNWENNGFAIKNNIDPKTKKVRSGSYNENYITKKGLTWTYITSGPLGVRFVPDGFLFDNKGSMIFFEDEESIYVNLGFLCGAIAQVVSQIFNPTISFQPGNMATMPSPKISKENQLMIIQIVKGNIERARINWDSFETSWDFKRNPLL